MPSKLIQSDAFVGQEISQNITSDGNIMAPVEQTIGSDTFMGLETSRPINAASSILAETTQDIDADSIVQATIEQLLTSDTFISSAVFLLATAQVDIPGEAEMEVESEVLNPIPSVPTSLVAIDAGTGDAVNLTWSSSAPFHNVYKKVGIILTKLNPTLLGSNTFYLVGGLPTDAAVTFVVKGVNGIGQESPESNEATATPTFIVSRFQTFTYEVKVNDVKVEDAILSNVNLTFGSNLASAAFTLPRDPRTASNPILRDAIDIVVNDKLIFRGVITGIAKAITDAGLVLNYTCHSNIIDLTNFTLFEIGLNGGNSRFNIFEPQTDGTPITKALGSARSILNRPNINVIGAPNVFPGYVDFTDMTPLEASESVLRKVGNFKVYHDMETGENIAYAFGSGGFQTREFIIGKNVIDYNVTTSDLDVVNRLTVIAAPTRIRNKRLIRNLDKIARDPDGKLAIVLTVRAEKARDIQVFANARDKPRVEFNDAIQVAINDFIDPTTAARVRLRQFAAEAQSSFGENIFSPSGDDPTNNEIVNEDTTLRPIVTAEENFDMQRAPIPFKIKYTGNNIAQVFLSEVPKKWKALYLTGRVLRRSVEGIQGSPNEELQVKILKDYRYTIGSVEIEFTRDENPAFVQVGSGLPAKSITDGQYQVVVDEVNHIDTTAATLSRMSIRANSELARLKKPRTRGTITILGDETLDLRTGIVAEGEVLEISGISHSFSNGFVTTVELTNEPFFTAPQFGPIVQRPRPQEVEKGNIGLSRNFVVQSLAEVIKEAQRDKDNTDKQPVESTSVARYQPTTRSDDG